MSASVHIGEISEFTSDWTILDKPNWGFKIISSCKCLSGFMHVRLIVQVHARNKGFKSEQEKQELLTELASITFDYSGAELQNVL